MLLRSPREAAKVKTEFIWAASLGVGLFFFPESSLWLLQRNPGEEHSLALILADGFRKGKGNNGFRTWSHIALQTLQQLTGINFVFYYCTAFIQSHGIENAFTITAPSPPTCRQRLAAFAGQPGFIVFVCIYITHFVATAGGGRVCLRPSM
ncbi:BQ2448_1243 [Microbotryum intermedium]|uniref:BQ2448_1243 protein n=1 Tax=Microbotryum intermedium TaxID=269621 RepID=A0A238FAP1_9BASI|nr:BQ2448_1243 [Microbotryum intermedium]